MSDHEDRMRELRERMERLQRETAPEIPDKSERPAESAVQRREPGKARAVLFLLGLALATVVVLQLAFTVLSYSGNDFDDARRTGQATVESCERRGPVGLIYGYWYACDVRIEWEDGRGGSGNTDQPHLFDLDDVGRTVEIGDNGLRRGGQEYSRPDFPNRPLLTAGGVVLFVIGAVPALFLGFLLLGLVRNAFRRR